MEEKRQEPVGDEKTQDAAPEMVTITKQEWEERKNEALENKDKYLRILAESENLRKRLQKEKVEMQGYIKEHLIAEFLNPIDSFENALSFKDKQSQEVQNWMIGFEMILTQFRDVLAQNDVRAIDALGKKFDPFMHEAVEIEESETHPPQTVIKEFMKGYAMGDRVIRPTKVKVAKAKSSEFKETPDLKTTNEETKN